MSSTSQLVEARMREGMLHVRNRDFALAADSFRLASEADPGHGPALNNLGCALAVLGRHDEAAEAFRRSLRADPSYAQAHFNLGASLKELGMKEEAFSCFARTVELDPRHDEAHYNLGLAHRDAGRLDEALACQLRASEISPRNPEILRALAGILVRMREPTAAARVLEHLLNLNTSDDRTRVHLMDQLARDCDWDRLDDHRPWIPRLGIEGPAVQPFALLTFDDDPLRHRVRSERFAQANFAAIEPFPAPPLPSARPEKLRIGYFSADFHDHATMFLAARLFELHDRDRFEIHAYSFGPQKSDAMRERAARAFDDFKEVGELSNLAVAELARRDRIDIAIDLKGYTEGQRLAILAHRPAPIQMTYLGYPGTLGTSFIDYNIVDSVVVPDEAREAYSERLIVLPHSYQANDDRRVRPTTTITRADAGLPPDGFVFGCFNYSYKISPAEFEIWLDLLRQVDGSLLWLLACPGNMRANLGRVMERNGIDPARLVIAPRVELDAHMTRLQLTDLFLDTFNYNAHTTASDALWVGVPVVTKAGKSFSSRVAASLLRATGMDELVTDSAEGYAQLALALAKDPERLAALRAKLVANRPTAPLFDSALFTRHFEAGLDLAYARYLAGQEPADIVVPA